MKLVHEVLAVIQASLALLAGLPAQSGTRREGGVGGASFREVASLR